MVGLVLKPRDVYNSWEKKFPTIDEETEIPLFVVFYGSLKVLI
jgi:hypothetical protein